VAVRVQDVGATRQASDGEQAAQRGAAAGLPRWPPQTCPPEVETLGRQRVGDHFHLVAEPAQLRREIRDVGADAAGAAAHQHDDPHQARPLRRRPRSTAARMAERSPKARTTR
jgi:hypothetical protein